MARRSPIPCGMLLAAAAVATAPAAADEAGCAALGQRVTAGVVALLRERGLSLPDAANGGATRMAPATGGPHTCTATAAVASRAFSEALRGLSVRLTWHDDWTRPGDYCLSHYLDQCYPRHDRLSPLPPPPDFAFVARAWRSVTRAVSTQMPYGAGGDLSRFTDASLASALSSELRASFGMPAGTLREALEPRGPRPR